MSSQLAAFLATLNARTLLATDEIQNFSDPNFLIQRPPVANNNPLDSILFSKDSGSGFDLFLTDTKFNTPRQISER